MKYRANQYAAQKNDNKQRYVDSLGHQVISSPTMVKVVRMVMLIMMIMMTMPTDQVADKQDYNRHSREYDEEQQKQHFQSWETFWGRPGYGAPREVVQKGNLMKMLHYPEKVVNVFRACLCISARVNDLLRHLTTLS